MHLDKASYFGEFDAVGDEVEKDLKNSALVLSDPLQYKGLICVEVYE